MLNTAKLIRAGDDTSNNEWLQAILGTANAFNNRPNLEKSERVLLLDRLLACVASWITSHPPKQTDKNLRRWSAMADLAKQVEAEAQKLEVRFLSGPADWKQVGENQRHYWLERIDDSHRAGFTLSLHFDAWCRTGRADQSFWDYLGVAMPDDIVKYYGGTPNALKRKVTFQGNLLYNSHDHLFDTQHLSTIHAGRGWCIFVVDTDGTLFAHKHVESQYHHSTFTGGAAVQAAGEMVVDQGLIKVITAKSGHYTPTSQEMQKFVSMFPNIPGQAVIMPNFSSDTWYRVRTYRFEGEKAKKLTYAEVKAQVPDWAFHIKSDMEIFSKIQGGANRYA